jgi:hypothetical protein
MDSSIIPSLVFELLEYEVPVKLAMSTDNELFYEISGFYKSGTISLFQISSSPDVFEARSRYGRKAEVQSLKDLALENLHWWQSSSGRYDGWVGPDPYWLPLLQRYDLVKLDKTIPVYVSC